MNEKVVFLNQGATGAHDMPPAPEHKEWIVTIKFSFKNPITAAQLVRACLRVVGMAEFGYSGMAAVTAEPVEK
jgi:hypothetical protein